MGSWVGSILSNWVIIIALLLSLPSERVRAQASGFVLGFSRVDVFGGHGVRKLLQSDLSGKSSVGPPNNWREDEHGHGSIVTPLVFGVLLPGTFIAFCVVFCAWFHKRRQATTHTVLTKDMPSMDSSASFETNLAAEKAFSHEKYMGSPLRQPPGSPLRQPPGSPLRQPPGSPLRQPPGSPLHFPPGSPLRVPPSPLRVPPSPRFSMSPRLTRAGSIHLNYNQVVKFTHNFAPALRIGKGGFGTVYKAQLEDGRVVAIKRAKREYFKGLRTEFSSEVELLAKIDHRSLVKLLGYVDHGDHRFIITEYVPNGTLREHLDGSHGRLLEFNQRIEIAIDVVHGLTYLHSYAERQIIHRDVKSSNILLTDSLRAKVADFGFARLGAAENGDTHVETNIKGTVGYLDPEYMRTYRLTTKSDVYSFGVLLTEMLTGRRAVEPKRPLEERVTVTWAFKKFDDGHVFELLDPRLEERVDTGILMRIFGLAMQCAAPVRSDRPEMRSVGEQLWAIRADYLKTSRSA